MSTLNVENISDGTDTTATANVVNGSAKAWAQCDETGSIGASYNISSVSESGNVYTVNFESAFEDTSYVVQLTAGDDNDSTASPSMIDVDNRTTSVFKFEVQNSSGTAVNTREYIAITVFR